MVKKEEGHFSHQFAYLSAYAVWRISSRPAESGTGVS
jgi:hypothetical protein